MASVNKVILVGNLGQDPEVRYLPSGQAVASFSVATTEKWTGKDGMPGEKTEWHRVTVWGKQGENCKEFLKKGRQVYLEGRLQTREWDDKEGNKRKTTEVVADKVVFLGGGGSGGGGGRQQGGYSGGQQGGEAFPEEPSILGSSDDDIPF